MEFLATSIMSAVKKTRTVVMVVCVGMTICLPAHAQNDPIKREALQKLGFSETLTDCGTTVSSFIVFTIQKEKIGLQVHFPRSGASAEVFLDPLGDGYGKFYKVNIDSMQDLGTLGRILSGGTWPTSLER